MKSTTKKIFVKAGLSNAYIHIKGTMKSEPYKSFEYTQHICDTDASATSAKKKYAVKYQLSTNNGLLQLTIRINQEVDIINIEVPAIDPYENNNSTQQS